MDKTESIGSPQSDGQAEGAAGRAGGDPRDRLLAACGDLHGAVEAHPRMARLLSPDLDLPGLADSLTALHAGIARVELWLEAEADPTQIDPAQIDPAQIDPALADLLPLCDSAARLNADLAALTGRSLPLPAAASPFVPDALPLVMEPPVGAGSLWVLWGAHKGNAVVGAALARGLYRRTDFRSRYFSTLPEDRQRYDRLMRLLRRMPPAEVERRLVPQALAAFRALHASLEGVPALDPAAVQRQRPA